MLNRGRRALCAKEARVARSRVLSDYEGMLRTNCKVTERKMLWNFRSDLSPIWRDVYEVFEHSHQPRLNLLHKGESIQNLVCDSCRPPARVGGTIGKLVGAGIPEKKKVRDFMLIDEMRFFEPMCLHPSDIDGEVFGGF